MGAGFCNFRVMQWNTDTPLSQPFLQEQIIRESSKVDEDHVDLFHGNVTHPEREIVPRKTTLSCYTKRVTSSQPLRVIGF
jgi:hypothetical protein